MLDQLARATAWACGASTASAARCGLIEVVTSLDERARAPIPVRVDRHQHPGRGQHPGGKNVFHLFGALAEYERDLIRDRTKAGVAAARARVESEAAPRPSAPSRGAWPANFATASTPWTPSPKIVGTSRVTLYRHLRPASTDPSTRGQCSASSRGTPTSDSTSRFQCPHHRRAPGPTSPVPQRENRPAAPPAPPKLQRHADRKTAAAVYMWSHPAGVRLEA